MTAVYVLAALFVIAAAFFLIPRIPNPVTVIPHRPQPQPGGGLLWEVDFQLWFRPRRDGYVVQYIRIHERVAACDDPEFTDLLFERVLAFWEAWPVRAGARIPNDRADGVANFDDAFSYGIPVAKFPPMNRRGRVRVEVRAIVRFYEGITLPATFITGNPATQAGAALSDVAEPPFWRTRSGGARHDLTYQWDNCGGVGNVREVIDEHPKFKE